MPIVEVWLALAITVLLVVGFGVCLLLDKRRSVWVDRRFPGTGRTRVLYGDYGAAGRTEHRMYTTERLYRTFKSRKWPVGGAVMQLTPCVIVTDPRLIEHVLDDGEFAKVRPSVPGMHGFRCCWDAYEEERFEDFLRVATEEAGAVADALGRSASVTQDVKAIGELVVVRTLARTIFGRRWNERRQLPLVGAGDQRPPSFVGSVLATIFPNQQFLQRWSAFFHLDSPTLLEELVHSLAGECSTENHILRHLTQLESRAGKSERVAFGRTKALLAELVQNVFYIASGTLIACLYELAVHPAMQERLHAVLKRSGNTMVDDLDKVIGETLRKYPPVDEISFVSAANNRLPGCDLVIPKHTRVTIPVYAIHRDPEYYPQPNRFDPTRPTVRSHERGSGASCLYRPLGDKPLPVGANFAMMLVRVGLTSILARCKVRLTPESPASLEMCPAKAIPYPRGKVVLLIKGEMKRTDVRGTK